MVSLAGKCLPAEDASAIYTVAAAIERKWKMQQDTCNWRWKEERKEETFPDQTQESLRKKTMREKKRVTLSTVINLFSLHNIRNTQPPLAMSVKGCMLFCNLSGLQKALSRWCTLQFVYVANLNHFVNGASYLYSSFCDAAGMEACSVCSYHDTKTFTNVIHSSRWWQDLVQLQWSERATR